jgi:long-chain acyl-CoA synthetase
MNFQRFSAREHSVMKTASSGPTLFDAFLNSTTAFKGQPAFIYRADGQEFTVDYEKLFEDVLLLARSFRGQGIEKGTHVFLLSDNRYAWFVTDLALISIGAVSIPRGSETPAQELEFLLNHSESSFLIVENDRLLDTHWPLISASSLKKIFVIASERDVPDRSVRPYSELLADRTISQDDLDAFLSRGKAVESRDVMTIIYTSGTTGLPKGVMLTHANIMHNVTNLPKLIRLSKDDRLLSILPSWHIFERTVEYMAMAKGCCQVYSSLRTFAADLERYQPTMVATVPRLWESLYSRINAALKKESPRKQKLFGLLVSLSAAYRRHRRRVRGHLPQFAPLPLASRWVQKMLSLLAVMVLWPLSRLADRKLSLVRQKFGGRLRLAVSGGGSLPPYLDEWIDAIGIRIVNAYGMTECSPGIAGRGLDCHVFGTIGPPFPLTDIRIASEDGQDLPAGQEGEIQVRGPQVFKGYFNNEQANLEAFTRDGFFKTGDLGRMTVSGELVITGRAKDIIVLASGENIDPTHIESTITRFPFVQDAVLVGQDKKGLGALIVPDLTQMSELLSEMDPAPSQDPGELLDNGQLLDRARHKINALLNEKTGFKPCEKLQSIHFLKNEFTLGEELTNTLKKKRHVIERKYQHIINSILK